MFFRDRSEAGQRLGAQLIEFANRDVLVLALPRGGVPVGFEVAQSLNAPMDVLVVRKLGVPGRKEVAMGAIASGGVRVLNWRVVRALAILPQQIDAVAEKEAHELQRREQEYRGNRRRMEVAGRTVILVDDGLATGSTMRAAVAALRHEKSLQIIVAVPVAAPSTCAEIEKVADRVVCLYTPLGFLSVSQWYQNFSQTSDEEVRELLDRAAERVQRPVHPSGGDQTADGGV
jgi:putative phosphoribosyl transferase